MEETVPFSESPERQAAARELSEKKYASSEDRSFGLLRDYDNDPKLADEVRRLKPWKVFVVCLAGENRSRLVAEVLEDRGEKKRTMNYLAAYGGTRFSFPVMEEEIGEFAPDAIIFAARSDRKAFEKKYPVLAEKLEQGKILGRVIGLRDSEVALAVSKGTRRVLELKGRIKDRLKEMGFDGLTDEDLIEKWSNFED